MPIKKTDRILAPSRLTGTVAATLIGKLDRPSSDDRRAIEHLKNRSGQMGIEGAVAAAQILWETGNLTSPRVVNDFNYAGVAITGDDVVQPFRIASPEDGIDLYLQCLYSAVTHKRFAGFPVPASCEQWFARVWLPKVQSPSYPVVKTIDDLNIIYERNRATWAADPAYQDGVPSRGNAFMPGLPDQEFTSPVDHPPQGPGGKPLGAKIILNMGHRDTTGGGTAGGGLTEQGTTDNIVIAVRDALRAAGHTVYVNQELDGDVDNTFMNKNLDYVGRNAVLIDQQFGPVDAYLSFHLEGSSAPGLFGIVPDGNGLISAATGAVDPGDTWADNPKDVAFARALATRCSASTGLAKRSTTEPGVMSERSTGVGGSGWRLSEFHETYPMRGHATRNIFECGAMPNAHDIAIIRQPNFPQKIAAGVVAAVNDVFGSPVIVDPPKPPKPPKTEFPSEERLAGLFGDVRAYSTNGPVSKAWKAWCFENGLYPALARVYLAAGGFTDYIFTNGLYIRFNPETNKAYVLSKENAA